MDKQRIEYLHQRYIEGTLSPAETAEWGHILRTEKHAATIQALMHTTWTAITPENQQSLSEKRANRIFGQVVKLKLLPHIHTSRTWLGAAAILLMAAVAFWFFRMQQPTNTTLMPHDVAPGGNRATLSLTDGTTVDLSENQTRIVVNDGITYADGSAVSLSGPTDGGEAAHNYILRTPIGGTYQVSLPDGTDVWLNAASTLTYPSRFTETERRVTLTGEAYFSVTENAAKPFVVHSRDQRIEVVGTEFNVSAYPDEAVTATTLLAGRVNVASSGNGTATPATVYHLSPGQQSVLQHGVFHIHEVDTDQYTAWRDGRFNFDGKTLPDVMRELARWYGIKVAYKGAIPDLVFYGGARRNNNLALVLTLLETNGINYQLMPDTTLILSITD